MKVMVRKSVRRAMVKVIVKRRLRGVEKSTLFTYICGCRDYPASVKITAFTPVYRIYTSPVYRIYQCLVYTSRPTIANRATVIADVWLLASYSSHQLCIIIHGCRALPVELPTAVA